jgi:uncharacterized LabA/DUF88 family protein
MVENGDVMEMRNGELKATHEKVQTNYILVDGMGGGNIGSQVMMDRQILAAKVDVIVLVSGDGDYVHLVEYLQNTFGCRVEVIAFAESASAKLLEKADDFMNLSDNKKRFLI